MSLEREVKLGAGADFVLPDITGFTPGGVVSVAPPRWLRATYWDTADLRLARAGITLRHRAGEEPRPGPEAGAAANASPGGSPDPSTGAGRWTVKLPGSSAGPGGLLSRAEIDFEGAPEAVPGSAAGLVRAHVRSGALLPVVRLSTRRISLELRDAEGAAVAQVDDDEVTVEEVMVDVGDGGLRRFREVEVELTAGASENIAQMVVDQLLASGATAADPMPKAVRALGVVPNAAHVGLGPYSPPGAVPAGPATTTRGGGSGGGETTGAGALVREAIGDGVSRLLRYDPGVRLGDDPEDVHQARVATRRLRCDLATLSPLLEESWARHLGDELAWLGDTLGAVRDNHVLLDQLRTDAQLLPEVDYRPAASLLEAFRTGGGQAHQELAEALDSPRYLALLDALVDGAEIPPLTPQADAPGSELAPALVGTAWRRLAKAVDELGDAPSDRALHQVRIKAKRCRYAAEAVVGVAGKPARRLAGRVASLQGVLGELQDCVVAEARLRQMVDRPDQPLAPEVAAAAGALMEIQRRKATGRRRQWAAAWRKAAKPKVGGWLN